VDWKKWLSITCSSFGCIHFKHNADEAKEPQLSENQHKNHDSAFQSQLMLSFSISNICKVASTLVASAAGLDPTYALLLLFGDFAKQIFNLSSCFFRDRYWPVTKRVRQYLQKVPSHTFGQLRNIIPLSASFERYWNEIQIYQQLMKS
jgi:hypothetical protein